MVHFLEPGQRYDPDKHAPASTGGGGILDAGNYEGTQFLVTPMIAGFTTLADWLGAARSTAPAPPPRAEERMYVRPPSAPAAMTAERAELASTFRDVTPRPPVGAPARDTGEFTAMFGGGAPAAGFNPVVSPPPPVAPPPAAVAPPPPAAQQDLGEFTEMFGEGSVGGSGFSSTPAVPAPSFAMPPAPPPMPPGPFADSKGEFTMMFQTPPAASLPSAPRSPAAPANASGEFTMMFGDGGPSAPTPVPPQPAAPSYLPPRHTPAASPDSGFAARFLPPDQGGLPPAPPELNKPGAFAAPPAPPLGIGEFTEMFGGGARTPAAPAPPQPYSPPTPQQHQPAFAYTPPAVPQTPAANHSFDGATQVFRGPMPSAPVASPLPATPAGPGEFTMVMRGGGAPAPGGGMALPPAPPQAPAPPAAPSAGGGGFPAVPDFQAPQFQKPQMSAPSVTGPSVSAAGITPPSMQAPHFTPPSMSAPQMQMPPMQLPPPAAPAAPPPAAAAAGSGFPPILIAVVSCLGTIAVLAILYVLLKR